MNVGNTKSQNWISGGLEKVNVHNACHHATARCIYVNYKYIYGKIVLFIVMDSYVLIMFTYL